LALRFILFCFYYTVKEDVDTRKGYRRIAGSPILDLVWISHLTEAVYFLVNFLLLLFPGVACGVVQAPLDQLYPVDKENAVEKSDVLTSPYILPSL
jgi:hypothetical protein